ncbi:protein Aster-C-like isoform X2 [Cylas formicarius]|uniref:protein Aster-C-like isoform X2 n=1 Tax=Cylas formicarius TaxID=197179 RepID=UPI002958BB8A|nr:protein Aster-C-like isoform X2 [Cylas formicarius]
MDNKTADSIDDAGNDVDRIKCSNPHEGKLLVNEVLSINVDELFTLLFTSSKFYLDFHAFRKTTNLIQTPWNHNNENNSENRVINMTYAVTQPIGPKTSEVTETQRILPCSKAGIFYAIDVDLENAGIPYADSFYSQIHYCLKKVSNTEASISIYSQLIFRKKIWGLVKGMLEKNVWAGTEEFFDSLKNALLQHISGNISKSRPNLRKKHHRRGNKRSRSSVNGPPKQSLQLAGFKTSTLIIVVVILCLLLLFLNIYLYSKLRYLEENYSSHVVNWPKLKNLSNSHDELHELHQENAETYSPLKTTLRFLKQVEQSFVELKKVIKPIRPKEYLGSERQDALAKLEKEREL